MASKLRAASRAELLCIIFYIVSGVMLLVLLPFSNFAPHLALVGILSFITAVTLLTKKSWVMWFVAVLFVVVATFSLSTMFSIGFSNLFVTASLAAYFAIALIATLFLGLWRKPSFD